MILSKQGITVRKASREDMQDLASLIHFETYVHRHLDYRPPLDWVGRQPFKILERDNKVVAALACPPDPAEVAWIRLFASSHHLSPEKAWRILWAEVRAQLDGCKDIRWIAAIPMYKWFEVILRKSQFQRLHRIILLSWNGDKLPQKPSQPYASVRPMSFDDLKYVEQIDRASFVPIWQNSLAYLEVAFRQAAVATVAEHNGELVGYQISTATAMGGHLARLAVLPQLQQRGIGYTLLCDLLAQFKRRSARNISVNTQHDNTASMNLYKKAGFQPTGEEYTIYHLPL